MSAATSGIATLLQSFQAVVLMCHACRSFDKDNIDAEIVKKLQPIISKEEFEPKKVRPRSFG